MRWEFLLEELGKAAGLKDLVPDKDGSCSLLFDGEHEVTLIRDEAESTVFLYGRVADDNPGLGAEEWRVLLTACCLGAETDGAAFGLHGKNLILWKRHDAFKDYKDMEKALNGFLARLIQWKQRLAADRGLAPESASGEGMLRV